MLLIPWFIPTLTSIVRNMFDHRTRLTGFQDFFRNNSILFLLFYFTAILIGSFSPHTFSWVNQLSISAANFTPFMGLATQIEDFIYQENTLFDILSYLVVRIAVFLPYGFYCTLLLRKQSRLLRLLVLLLFPAILEIIQYFFYIERCDIDDVIYALFGGILGAGSYHLFHTIFRFVSGKEFLERETDYGFANSKIHF
jgi:glycopeptide antibiotics resistance protein